MMVKSQRVLVTGAGGFVGRAMCAYLRSKSIAVWGLDQHPVAELPDLLILDLLDNGTLRHVLQEIQPACIFHLAGAVGTHDEAVLYQAHVETTRVLLTIVAQTVPKTQVIILGSAAEYGSQAVQNRIVAEGAEALPESIYGQSKLRQSQIAVELAEKLKLDVLRVRLFNTLGPGQGAHLVAGAMVKRLYDCLYGAVDTFELFDPYSERDFLDVRDVARLLWLIACQRPTTQYQFPIHVASGSRTSILDLGRCLYQIAGVTEKCIPMKLIAVDNPTYFVAQTDVLLKLLSGDCLQRFTVSVSLRDMWQWYVEEQEKNNEIRE